ncbi:MAG: hypothetical protein KF857_09625 [Fimbriimonadaceae bacterium]|nr:hypothetical protein [Fimbriimonadaceae bacterium]
MKPLIALGCLLLGLFATGCNEPQSDLTKEDKVKMDKLFREGVKPNQTPAAPAGQKAEGQPGPRGSAGQPLNAADQ